MQSCLHHLARLLTAPLAVAVLTGSTFGGGAAPNILFILMDDVGLDAIGSYGVGDNAAKTPTLDYLAANGVRFNNAWSHPLCSPTRAAIQTGKRALRTGVGAVIPFSGESMALGPHALQLHEKILPEMLDEGTGELYAHAAIGKWHMSNVLSGAYLGANIAGYSHFKGQMGSPTNYFNWEQVTNGVVSNKSGYLTSSQARDASVWIAGQDQPWFCYLAMSSAHVPLHVPPPKLFSPVDLEEVAMDIPQAMFEVMVESMDSELLSLIKGLGDKLPNTNVIIMGDNGGFGPLVDPPYIEGKAKGTVYQGGVQVPLIVFGPAVAEMAKGQTCDALVEDVDLFATIAELAGVDLATALPQLNHDGVSIVDYLQDPTLASKRASVFTEYFFPNGFGPYSEWHRAIRDQRYKLIRKDETDFAETQEEFYDLLLDPYETVDLMPVVGSMDLDAEAAFASLQAELDAIEGQGGGSAAASQGR